MIFNIIIKLIIAINANVSVRQISFGFALGSILGFSPLLSPQALLLIMLIYLLNLNTSAALVSAGLFKILAVIFSYWTDKLGYFILVDQPAFQKLWTDFYNLPIIPFTKFNNTVVMGNFIVSILLFIPVYFTFKYLLLAYRGVLQKKLQQLKFFQVIKSNNIYKSCNSIYQSYLRIKETIL